MTNRVDDNWSYRLGVGYGNPEIKDPSAKTPNGYRMLEELIL